MRPPLLPEETLSRLYRIARIDGTGVLVLASAFALAAAIMGDLLGTVIGLLVAGAGAVELHGTHLLREGYASGLRWLIASQLSLLWVVLAYCMFRLVNFQPELIDLAITPDLRASFLQLGYSPEALDQLVERIYYVTYSLVALVTLVYQGGMALYYSRRRAAVVQAIANAQNAAD